MFLHLGHREVILATFVEYKAAFRRVLKKHSSGKTLSLPHLIPKYKIAAERSLTLL